MHGTFLQYYNDISAEGTKDRKEIERSVPDYMKMMKNNVWNRKNSRNGFTLVEVIVVLVIMTILSAISVPALTWWIGKAKEKQIEVNVRSVWLAAQAIVMEDSAQLVVTNDCRDEDSAEGAVARLADIEMDYTAEITVENGMVTEVIFTPAD